MEKMKKKIRWGVVSAANIASKVIPAIVNSKNSVVTAIASRDLGRAKSLAERYQIERVYDSYEKVLDPAVVDAVYIPLINSLHYKWSYEALKRGINVLCEKPLTMNAVQAKRLIDLASRKKLLIREGFMYRHHPQFRLINRLISKNTIGKIRSIYSAFTFFIDDPHSYILKREYGGGSLMDVGCYCVHFSRMITGREPIKVFALMTGNDADLNMKGLMDLGRGTQAIFESSINEYEHHFAIIRGEKGEIELSNPWTVLKNTEVIVRTDRQIRQIKFPCTDSYKLQIEAFEKDLINKNYKNIYDPYFNMKVIDALRKSAKSGKPVYIR